MNEQEIKTAEQALETAEELVTNGSDKMLKRLIGGGAAVLIAIGAVKAVEFIVKKCKDKKEQTEETSAPELAVVEAEDTEESK